MIGKKIVQYQILEEIGRGGMGSVFKALDTQLDRTVVLKLLLKDRLTDDDSRKRFVREARLASALDHPNICTIYEIHQTNEYLFIAMQYVDGQTLKKTINNAPLATPTCISIALQIADALAVAHDRGIIHRDIKPHNIMITPRGQVKILDFGLAKNLDETSGDHFSTGDLTVHGAPMGTPSYMSPEQVRGERADRRADIYGFGVVLFEMATGRKPFEAKNRVDLLHAVCNDEAPFVAEFNPDAPVALEMIVRRAMAKYPADRYQSMNDMLAELKRLATLAESAPEIPDGIGKPFAAVERVPWWHRLFSRQPGRSQPAPPRLNSITPTLSTQPAPAVPDALPADDFPIIPGAHKTLAILPFRSLGNATDASFSLALVDTLIVHLAAFKSLTIRPSSYVREYLDCEVDPAEVARELRADAVLLGSVLRAADTYRVTTQLVHGASGEILWAGKIDVDSSDPIRLHDEISQHLVARLTGRERPRAAVDLLRDESEEIRLDAVSTLKFSRDPAAAEALAEALGDESPRVKAASAEALARFGRAAAQLVIERLQEAIQAEDFAAARFAAKAAGMIGSAEVVPALLEALASHDSFLASEAALALGMVRDERAHPELVDALERPDANVRFTSTQALGLLGDPRALPALETRLREDEDEGVRAKALWAISRIKRNRVRPTTGRFAVTSTAGVRPARVETAP